MQNNFDFGALMNTGVRAFDGTRIVWGGQYRQDVVTSKRQWLSDRDTNQDIEVAQRGAYFQTETPLSNKVRLVLAGRFDKHDNYDGQFSPKAALTFSPVEDQTLRVSYNRAFKSPSLLQTDFYFPNFSPSIGIFGNKRGFVVKDAAGVTVSTIEPIRPEINNTWEFGYKGIVRQRLFVDAVVYQSRYEDFLSPLFVFANPFAGTSAFYPDGSPIFSAPQIALTYLNVGEAKVRGADLGLRFYITDRVVASGNMGLIRLEGVKKPTSGSLVTAGNEATAFNSPSTKWNAGLDLIDVIPRSTAGFTVRYVNRYLFRSGVNYGTVPTFGTLDVNYSVRTPWNGVRLTAQVQNLFACAGEFQPAKWVAAANKATVSETSKCGFGQQHVEMVSAPALGSMVFVGARFDRGPFAR
ncbi:MAG: TonB-dependent receptor [Gemmatimonadaceae bacterium]